MTEACIVGWAHSPFGKLDDPDIEALIGRVARRRDRRCRHRAARCRGNLRQPVQQRLLRAGLSRVAGAAARAGAAVPADHAVRERLRVRVRGGAWRARFPRRRARPVRAGDRRREDDRDAWRGGRRHPAEGQLPEGRGRHPRRVRRRVRPHRRDVFPALWRPVGRAGGDRGEEPQERRGQSLCADAQGPGLRLLPHMSARRTPTSRRR